MTAAKLFRQALGGAMLFAGSVGLACAAPVFVGTFQTDDGPLWGGNPDVFSAVEAAALLFGGDAGDYRVSIDSSADPASITDTGWYSRIGISGAHEFADDFRQDLGGPGYGADGWVDDDDISAYVDDNVVGSDFTMYVWRDLDVEVPEPATAAMLILGLAAVGYRRRGSSRS